MQRIIPQFWRVDIDPSKIVLGLGFYGRSFTLEDSSCWQPGCAFSGPGAAGSCTQTPGILSYKGVFDPSYFFRPSSFGLIFLVS